MVIWIELLVILGLTGSAALIGYLANGDDGAVFMVVCALGIYILRNAFWMAKILRWAGSPLDAPAPSARGSWAELFDVLYRRERRVSEQGVVASEELDRLRRAAEALPEGVLIIDGHRAVEWMNYEAEACLGLRANVDTGHSITQLLREPQFLAYLNSSPRQYAPLVLQLQRRPGRSLQVQAVPFAGGRTLLMVRDITQLEKLATMRRDFVANVSHELKTPLTVVLGFIETASDVLAEGAVDEAIRYLETASEQARRMQHLVDDLLMLSSLETDALPQEEDIDMAALLTELQIEAAALSAGRHRIDTRSEGAMRLRGSPREIHSAFGNLFSNAVRYTPAGGHIEVTWTTDAHGASFAISDSGPGIAAEHLPRLTERFYRVDRGRSRELGGTGLGLAIVKHVLERHQGRLEIESEIGRGSIFRARFPAERLVGKGETDTKSARSIMIKAV
ncbi:MAG: phosphate regulon sensor histidine kinase PhoR [Betaproteobacteria bacterium HGW-Betaproteobacteria-11]|nr:MAG: phosphate regulon sensor histidine kinase PhoR [Betaproteobacteria bacterium HGW-Betaproteobacteria-11]